MTDKQTDNPFPFEVPEPEDKDKRAALASNKAMWITLRQHETNMAALSGRIQGTLEAKSKAITLTETEMQMALLALCAANSGILLRKFGVITDE